MNEDFAPFELAVKLKEKGFDWQTFDWYDMAGNFCKGFMPRELMCREYYAPTISQVLKWLRDTHKLFVSPCVIADYQDDFHRDTTYWSFSVVNIESGDSIYREYERVIEKRYESYEQAALAGIEYVLDNLI